MLSDSIAKYVTLNNGDVLAFRGDTITRLTDRIAFSEVDVKGYARIIVHVGSNDLSNLVKRGNGRTVSMFEMLARYKALRNTIKQKNSSALLIISSILPRKTGFLVFRPFTQGMNFALERWCAKSRGSFVFLPSFRQFLYEGLPMTELFSEKDGLHLRGAGVVQLQTCFQQGLSTGHLLMNLRSKRTKMLAEVEYVWK